jgi:hypothetical protein
MALKIRLSRGGTEAAPLFHRGRGIAQPRATAGSSTGSAITTAAAQDHADRPLDLEKAKT